MTTSTEQMRILLDFLRTRFPRDVLIPCAVGAKRPLHKYAHGQWNWEQLDSFVETSGAQQFDWAILLRDICVVDVDSPDVAAELEAAHPALRDAPCEKTRKGFHYFFRRSTRCDEQGFWDVCGPEPVTAGIDFKSVTAATTHARTHPSTVLHSTGVSLVSNI